MEMRRISFSSMYFGLSRSRLISSVYALLKYSERFSAAPSFIRISMVLRSDLCTLTDIVCHSEPFPFEYPVFDSWVVNGRLAFSAFRSIPIWFDTADAENEDKLSAPPVSMIACPMS